MGINAVHTKYSTWDGAAKMKKFAENFKPATTPMAFEYPVIPGYYGYRGAGTQGVDFDNRIDFARMRKYRVERTKEQLKASNVGRHSFHSRVEYALYDRDMDTWRGRPLRQDCGTP